MANVDDHVGNETDFDMDGAWPLPTARPWPPNHPARPTAAPVSEMRVLLLDHEPTGTPETIYWRDAAEKPDCDITVLCWMAAGEWHSGWWDDERQQWMDCASAMPLDGVTHWAEPRGPGA